MGTAGLNVNRLAGLLERKKIECTLVDRDEGLDHCVLRLSSIKHPSVVAYLEYENQGIEPRFAGIVFRDDSSTPQKNDYPLDWQKELKLEGTLTDDPDKIAQWIEYQLDSYHPLKS